MPSVAGRCRKWYRNLPDTCIVTSHSTYYTDSEMMILSYLGVKDLKFGRGLAKFDPKSVWPSCLYMVCLCSGSGG
jgi:hypothetical protein